MQNIGLDFISGILRLLLNDYNDRDGQVRFENTLKRIKDYENKDKDKVFNRLIQLASYFEMNQKNLLVRSIDKIFKDRALLYRFSETIEDEYSLSIILTGQVARLRKVNQQIKEISWEIM